MTLRLQATPGNIRPRMGTAMAYDRIRHEIVLFGGASASSSWGYPWSIYGTLDDTWVYSKGAWTKQTTANTPPPRAIHAMGWDHVNSRVLLYGGHSGHYSGGTAYDDLWEWTGSDWNQLWTQTGARSMRGGYLSMAADELNDTMIIIGANSTGSGVIDLVAMTYAPGGASSGMSPRVRPGIAYSPLNQKLYSWSGSYNYLSGGDVRKIWEWNDAGGAWSDVTPTGAWDIGIQPKSTGFGGSPDPGNVMYWDPTINRIVLAVFGRGDWTQFDPSGGSPYVDDHPLGLDLWAFDVTLKRWYYLPLEDNIRVANHLVAACYHEAEQSAHFFGIDTNIFHAGYTIARRTYRVRHDAPRAPNKIDPDLRIVRRMYPLVWPTGSWTSVLIVPCDCVTSMFLHKVVGYSLIDELVAGGRSYVNCFSDSGNDGSFDGSSTIFTASSASFAYPDCVGQLLVLKSTNHAAVNGGVYRILRWLSSTEVVIRYESSRMPVADTGIDWWLMEDSLYPNTLNDRVVLGSPHSIGMEIMFAYAYSGPGYSELIFSWSCESGCWDVVNHQWKYPEMLGPRTAGSTIFNGGYVSYQPISYLGGFRAAATTGGEFLWVGERFVAVVDEHPDLPTRCQAERVVGGVLGNPTNTIIQWSLKHDRLHSTSGVNYPSIAPVITTISNTASNRRGQAAGLDAMPMRMMYYSHNSYGYSLTNPLLGDVPWMAWVNKQDSLPNAARAYSSSFYQHMTLGDSGRSVCKDINENYFLRRSYVYPWEANSNSMDSRHGQLNRILVPDRCVLAADHIDGEPYVVSVSDTINMEDWGGPPDWENPIVRIL